MRRQKRLPPFCAHRESAESAHYLSKCVGLLWPPGAVAIVSFVQSLWGRDAVKDTGLWCVMGLAFCLGAVESALTRQARRTCGRSLCADCYEPPESS